jgi:hypothetical protein
MDEVTKSGAAVLLASGLKANSRSRNEIALHTKSCSRFVLHPLGCGMILEAINAAEVCLHVEKERK